MSTETLFDPPAETDPAILAQRVRAAAAACIRHVQESYRGDATRASGAGLTEVARLHWTIVSELDRAITIAMTGTDPGDGSQPDPVAAVAADRAQTARGDS